MLACHNELYKHVNDNFSNNKRVVRKISIVFWSVIFWNTRAPCWTFSGGGGVNVWPKWALCPLCLCYLILCASVQQSEMAFGGYEENRFENTVGIGLLCPVCYKVLKDPVQCPNEHRFCRSCIQRILSHDAEACPVCRHPLTEKTLMRAPGIVKQLLDNLMILCDYEDRGCQEIIKLKLLDRHVRFCGYSPVRCTNTGCSEVLNRHHKERHERELCLFRKIVVCKGPNCYKVYNN